MKVKSVLKIITLVITFWLVSATFNNQMFANLANPHEMIINVELDREVTVTNPPLGGYEITGNRPHNTGNIYVTIFT